MAYNECLRITYEVTNMIISRIRALIKQFFQQHDVNKDRQITQGAQSKSRPGVVVLGQQLADAQKAENKRLAAGNSASSPLPDDDYDFWQGHYDLYDPMPSDLDEKIKVVCQQYASLSDNERLKMRDRKSVV